MSGPQPEKKKSDSPPNRPTPDSTHSALRAETSKLKESFTCAGCNQPITGMVVQALSKAWHPEHFRCEYCKQPIKGNTFNTNEGKAYCEQDYALLFLHKCKGCNLPIKDVVVVALNSHWHRDHFLCASCGAKLADQGFHEKDNNAFCEKCYEAKFCPKCKDCGNSIVDTAVVAMGEKYHQQCFKCSQCKQPLVSTTFEVINDKPVCAACSPKLKKSSPENK